MNNRSTLFDAGVYWCSLPQKYTGIRARTDVATGNLRDSKCSFCLSLIERTAIFIFELISRPSTSERLRQYIWSGHLCMVPHASRVCTWCVDISQKHPHSNRYSTDLFLAHDITFVEALCYYCLRRRPLKKAKVLNSTTKTSLDHIQAEGWRVYVAHVGKQAVCNRGIYGVICGLVAIHLMSSRVWEMAVQSTTHKKNGLNVNSSCTFTDIICKAFLFVPGHAKVTWLKNIRLKPVKPGFIFPLRTVTLKQYSIIKHTNGIGGEYFR